MKTIFTFVCFSFLAWTFVQAQPVPSSVVLDQLTSVNAIDDDRLLLTQFKGAKKAVMYDLAADSILYRFIPEGQGPGEATAILSAIYNEKQSRYIFFSRNSTWIQTDLKGKLIQESKTTLQNITHLASSTDGTKFLAFPTIRVPQQIIQDNEVVPVNFTIDSENLKVIDTLTITPQELGLKDIEEVSKINSVSLNFIGCQIDQDRILITYEGSRHLYLFKNGQLIEKKTSGHT